MPPKQRLVQQLPSTDITPLLLCHVLNTRNISIIEFLCVRACGEFKKTYIVLDAIDAYHDSPDILADIMEMINRLSNTTSVLFTTTHSDASSDTSIRMKFVDTTRLDVSTLVLHTGAHTSDTTVQASPDLVEEIIWSLTNPLYHNYARFFLFEPNPVPYLQRTAYKWQKRKLIELLNKGPPEPTDSTSDSELLRDVQIALLGSRYPDHIFRKFLVSSASWRNIIPLASKDPLMTVNFLQREIDTRAYVYNEAYYRARCIKCLLKVAETYLVIPTCLVISNIRCDARHPICGGGYADIYKGRINHSDVCLKVLRIFADGDTKPREDVKKEFCREVLVWRNLNHPNVVPFIGINDDLFYPSFCLISPWMNDGNLISFLAKNPGHNRVQCIKEVANGLHYLHSHEPQVIHADIRGANILVTSDRHCCLADFGLAKAVMTCGPGSYGDSTKGSVRWLAPELLQVDAPSNWYDMTSRDIYAFGCTMVEIFTGKVPFSDIIFDVTVIFAVLQNDRWPTRPSHTELPYDDIWSLMELCWSKDVHRRPSSSNLLTMLNNLELSQQSVKREKTVVKTVKTMINRNWALVDIFTVM
ncbi:kinase-like domain-containing protein [Armillaria mellea]|nr:kinase-like domain-containing protein [Armillaria mellea]